MTDNMPIWLQQPVVMTPLVAGGGLLVITLIKRVLRAAARRHLHDNSTRCQGSKTVNFAAGLCAALLLAVLYSDQLGVLTVAFGVAGAGVAFALRHGRDVSEARRLIPAVAERVVVDFSREVEAAWKPTTRRTLIETASAPGYRGHLAICAWASAAHTACFACVSALDMPAQTSAQYLVDWPLALPGGKGQTPGIAPCMHVPVPRRATR